MRKAMFMSGHLRNVGVEAAEFMRSQFDGDIFLATWDREDCTPGSTPIDREKTIKALNAKKLEIENFDVVHQLMVDKYKTFEKHHHCTVVHKNRKGHDSFCMLHIWLRSWMLLKAYEQEIGQKYDVVVRFRPDYVFKGLPRDFAPESNTLYFPSNCVFNVAGMCAITDNLFVADRETMEKMMVMPALADTYLLRENCHWTAEHLVHFQMSRCGIEGKKLNPLMYRSTDNSPIYADHMNYLPYKPQLIVATMMVHNEEDILADCIEHSLSQGVNKIILTDNGSTDSTREIAESYPEVTIIDEPSDQYRQGEWQTRMAQMAYDMGASWVVPIDADEFWDGIYNLTRVPDNFNVVLADSLYDHFPTDLIEEPFCRLQMPCFYRQPRENFGEWGIGRFAFRPYKGVEVGMGQHFLEDYKGTIAALKELWIHHYPIRSYPRYARKVKRGGEILLKGKHSAAHGVHWQEAYEKLRHGTLEMDYIQRRLKLKRPA